MKLSIFESLIRGIRLHWLYLKISYKHLSVYKMSALLTVLFSVVFLIAEILTVNVYYQFTDHIGDWDRNSFYILLGTFNIMTTIYTYLFEIAHDDFAYKIRFGELDSDLIRPMDSQAYTAIQRVDYASLFNLPLPIWLVYMGIEGLETRISITDLLTYVFLVAIGVLVVYLINQSFVNFSFWFTDISNLTTASDQIVQLGAKPLQVYPRLIQLSFSYVIPVILCTNLSVSVFHHKLDVNRLLILLGATTLFFFLVRLQWRLGLKRYSSASS